MPKEHDARREAQESRGSDVMEMQVMSWRGGAGQAAIGTSSDSCGSERRAGGLGSRLKDGRADSAPCDQLVCYTRCDFCSSTVSRVSLLTNQSSTFRLSSALPKRSSYYYRALRAVVDKNVSCITPTVSVQT